MRRRDLLLMAVVPPNAPVDEQHMNDFAALYNEYVERLRIGVIDTKLWPKVYRAWKRLVKE